MYTKEKTKTKTKIIILIFANFEKVWGKYPNPKIKSSDIRYFLNFSLEFWIFLFSLSVTWLNRFEDLMLGLFKIKA